MTTRIEEVKAAAEVTAKSNDNHEAQILARFALAALPVIEAAEKVLEVIDIHGGLGEYKGGTPFATQTLRAALAKLRESTG